MGRGGSAASAPAHACAGRRESWVVPRAELGSGFLILSTRLESAPKSESLIPRLVLF